MWDSSKDSRSLGWNGRALLFGLWSQEPKISNNNNNNSDNYTLDSETEWRVKKKVQKFIKKMPTSVTKRSWSLWTLFLSKTARKGGGRGLTPRGVIWDGRKMYTILSECVLVCVCVCVCVWLPLQYKNTPFGMAILKTSQMFYDGTHHMFWPLKVTLTTIQLIFTKGWTDANTGTTVMFTHYLTMFSQPSYDLATLFFFNLRIIALQYCVGFCHISTWISNRFTYVFSFLNLPHTHPLRSPHSTRLSSGSCTAASPWPSILHMVKYMFQGYSLNLPTLSIPHLCPQACSVFLVSRAALQLGSSVPFSRFHRYALYMIFVFPFLTLTEVLFVFHISWENWDLQKWNNLLKWLSGYWQSWEFNPSSLLFRHLLLLVKF